MDLERLLAYLDAPPLRQEDLDDDRRDDSSSGSDSESTHMDTTSSTADDDVSNYVRILPILFLLMISQLYA
jgi:hypothetical protein